MIKEEDIVYEDDGSNLWILKVSYGYEIYRNTVTHSIRCGIVGYHDIKKAIQMLNYIKGGN